MFKTDGEGGVWFQPCETCRRYLLPSFETVRTWAVVAALFLIIACLFLGCAGPKVDPNDIQISQ